MCERACACVRACVRACVCVCVYVCMCVCMCVLPEFISAMLYVMLWNLFWIKYLHFCVKPSLQLCNRMSIKVGQATNSNLSSCELSKSQRLFQLSQHAFIFHTLYLCVISNSHMILLFPPQFFKDTLFDKNIASLPKNDTH